MISIRNVNKWYGSFQVLVDCSTEVAKGEVVVVCGPSGSGKSTIIKCVNALEPFQKGEITVEGISVGDPKTHGEPIPDVNGKIISPKSIPLSQAEEGSSVKISAVSNDAKSFLDHLNSKGLQIGDSIIIKRKELFDGSVSIINKAKKETMLSHQVVEKIWVEL